MDARCYVKLLVVLLALMMCFCFFACGEKADTADTPDEQDVPKIEKTVDAVAAALGLNAEEKSEKAFEMLGAKDGAGFGDGYNGGFMTFKATAYNDGVILIGGEDNQELLDSFKALVFE